MHFFDSLWTSLISILSLSPVERSGIEPQAPLRNSSDVVNLKPPRGPIFIPPGGGSYDDFKCDYSSMSGWSQCNTPQNRGCWLRNDQTGVEFNISTDYESMKPNGITRHYTLNITDGTVNADGLNFTEAKVFNSTYPGPWIQACWGDIVNITVQNRLEHNGTSVHWHGIRQNLTMHMDGVNGVTQCPIAPGDNFTYIWNATQYGSSWYHSHYSVQYADGAVGPMTIHGPSSAGWDEPKSPLLMTDWYHNSAFEAIWPKPGPVSPSILLNGRGNITLVNKSAHAIDPPDPYTIHFDPPTGTKVKRYLLRLINTSFDSTFVFSIDNHTIQVIGADFVPINPYKNTSVLVGIGQRYHVTVEANDPLHGKGGDGNYWIRTWKANCFRFKQSDFNVSYETTGVLRYHESTARPKTHPWPPSNISLACSDETYTSLKPILKWDVPRIPKNDKINKIGELFDVGLSPQPNTFPLALFSIARGGGDPVPLQIDYSSPTFFKLNYTGKWNPPAVIIPENYSSTDWVFMALRGVQGSTSGAHPIHLHGHDFAILQQIENVTFPFELNLTYDNPPRRDVVLLPSDGYVVIAFKTDNPGVWLMHCHIAAHASFGLALQIMERQADARAIWPSRKIGHALANAQHTCDNWNLWWGNCSNWWAPENQTGCGTGMDEFSPDSGI